MCACCSRQESYQRPEKSNGRPLSVQSLAATAESPLSSLVAARVPALYWTKAQSVGELLTLVGLFGEDGGRTDGVERVFKCYHDMRRLQSRSHRGDSQQLLLARFELGRQFQTEQERKSESGSLIRAFSIAVHVEQILSAQSVRAIAIATSRAVRFIAEMGSEK